MFLIHLSKLSTKSSSRIKCKFKTGYPTPRKIYTTGSPTISIKLISTIGRFFEAFSRRSSSSARVRRTLERRGRAAARDFRPSARLAADTLEIRTALTGLPLPGQQLSLALGKTTLPLFSYPENRLSFVSFVRPRRIQSMRRTSVRPNFSSRLSIIVVAFVSLLSPPVKFSPRVKKIVEISRGFLYLANLTLRFRDSLLIPSQYIVYLLYLVVSIFVSRRIIRIRSVRIDSWEKI